MDVFISDIDGYVGSHVAAAVKRAWPAATCRGSTFADGSPFQGALNRSGTAERFPIGSPEAVAAAAASKLIILSLSSALVEAQAVVELLRSQLSSLPPVSNKGEGEDDADDAADGEAEAEDAGGGASIPGRVVIALSTALVWDRTVSVLPPWEEAAYRKRRPGLRTAMIRDTELALLATSRPDRGLRCHVVALGTPYGAEQGPLQFLFRRAWLCADSAPLDAAASVPGVTGAAAGAGAGSGTTPPASGLPVPVLRTDGAKNTLATVHVQDAARFVCKVAAASADLQPGAGEGEYFLAVDEGRDSVLALCAAISRTIGTGGVRLLSKEDSEAYCASAGEHASAAAAAHADAGSSADASGTDAMGTAAPDATYAALHLASSLAFAADTLAMHTDERVALADDEWHCREGVVAALPQLASEFIAAHDLRPMRIVVQGPPGSNALLLARALAVKYALPLVTPAAAVSFMRAGNLRALTDGTKERWEALAALREAVERPFVDAEAAAAAAAATERSVGGGKKKEGKAGKGGAPPAAAGPTPDAELQAYALEAGVKLPRALMARVLRAHLFAPEARNKGWVLADFPVSAADAAATLVSLPDEELGIAPDEENASADWLTGLREEVEEDRIALALAVRRGVAVTVQGAAVKAPPAASVSGADSDALEVPDTLPGSDVTELDARLRPTVAIVCDGSDEWLTAAGRLPPDVLTRQLKHYRLQNTAALGISAATWLEERRVDVLEVGADDVEARARAPPPPPPSTSSASRSRGATARQPVSDTPRLPEAVFTVARAALDAEADEDVRSAVGVWSASVRDGAPPAASVSAGGGLTSFVPPSWQALTPDACSARDVRSASEAADVLANVVLLKHLDAAVCRGGRPSNFQPLPAQTQAYAHLGASRKSTATQRATAEQQAVTQEEVRTRADNAMVESAQAQAAARAEAALLETRTAPLRTFLLTHVVPHLTAGLIEVCKAGPLDPVDHLAEYLFQVANSQDAAVHAATAAVSGLSLNASSTAASVPKR